MEEEGGLWWWRIHSVALRVDLPPVAARAWAANSYGNPILRSCSISILFNFLVLGFLFFGFSSVLFACDVPLLC